jgi:hypothetical protein
VFAFGLGGASSGDGLAGQTPAVTHSPSRTEVRMSRRRILASWVLAACSLLAWDAPARAQQWSGSITEPLWAIPGGGGGAITTGAYTLSGAAGQPAATVLTGGAYQLTGGYWSPETGGAPTATPDTALPPAFAFAPPSPNPFAVSTVLRFDLPAATRVTAEVFDLGGERVRTLIDETRPAGIHRIAWDGQDSNGRTVRSGVYFVRVRAGSAAATHRIVHID